MFYIYSYRGDISNYQYREKSVTVCLTLVHDAGINILILTSKLAKANFFIKKRGDTFSLYILSVVLNSLGYFKVIFLKCSQSNKNKRIYSVYQCITFSVKMEYT